MFRIHDRNYTRGDVLSLHEWEPENGCTGKCVSVRGTDVTDFMVWVGNYVMLSIQILAKDEPCGMSLSASKRAGGRVLVRSNL